MNPDARDPFAWAEATGPKFSGLPLYLLVDPYFGDPPSLDIDPQHANTFGDLASLRQTAWQGRVVEVAAHADPVIEPRALPYLVALDGPNDPVLAMAMQMAHAERDEALASGRGVARIGAFVETALHPFRVMERLQCMWVVSPHGTRRYLRFSDARVFELLTHLFDAQGLQNWLGPIAHWHYMARDARWHVCQGAAAESLVDGEEAMYHRAQHLETLASSQARLPWTPERLTRLNESQVLSRALTQLQRLDAATNAGYHTQGWAAIAQARLYGLQDSDDQVAYTWRALLNPGFENQPAYRVAINAAHANPGTLDAALTHIGTHKENLEALT